MSEQPSVSVYRVYIVSPDNILMWICSGFYHCPPLTSLPFGTYPPTATESESESESYVTTDGQSASLSWNKATICGLRSDFYYCRTVAGLLM
jgi:hypothetical protein